MPQVLGFSPNQASICPAHHPVSFRSGPKVHRRLQAVYESAPHPFKWSLLQSAETATLLPTRTRSFLLELSRPSKSRFRFPRNKEPAPRVSAAMTPAYHSDCPGGRQGTWKEYNEGGRGCTPCCRSATPG